ncbi:hypothetical protein RB195_018785 [Necator americanus]|uniref:Nose resistant-to-fluoxetine protein N-terminal domain-containing protein n=1 Tax=Necator americanus TaxID=51031 RepID=A0ABR1CB98_NECAM
MKGLVSTRADSNLRSIVQEAEPLTATPHPPLYLGAEHNSTDVDDGDGKCFTLIPMLNFGVCMPDTCTDYDVTRMITFAVRLAERAAAKDAVCDVNVECRHEKEEFAMSSNWMAMSALYFLTYTIIMMVFGTLYDLFIHQKEIEMYPGMDMNKREFEN